MNKQIKKMLSAVLSLAMVAGSVVLPTMASADEYTPLVAGDKVLKEWKFDFGAAGSTPEAGYTLVTPDTNYVKNTDGGYGFLGIDEDGYTLGDRLDAFGSQEGQIIKLAAGNNGGVGVVGAGGEDDKADCDLFGNAADEYYPARFALKVEDETYYRVKATVTTLDPSKDATVSLYTERKHPIYTKKKVEAGQSYTEEFSIRVTPIYYQKSNPTGAIKDEMVNICVLGENSAISSIEIQQVETLPTLWVLGDSTVTDGNSSLPFFPLQNYTGVGTGLTKYLPRTIAMVNEGEGGLDAKDSLHFDMVKSRIKEGDYMYVEYGHNHKGDGPTGYLSCLDKYYDVCHSKGAKLIIVSPIERINQWDNTAKKYTHSLDGFAAVGEKYVADKVAAGAEDIAYVDLNTYSLDFYNKIVADNDNNGNAIKFYFQTSAGAGTDTTHPNDTGAENLAYEFIKAAKAVTDQKQKAVLDGFLANITDETPNLVPEEITSLGNAPNDAWPVYHVGPEYTYPTEITDVEIDENGKFKSMSVNVIAGMATYALGVVEIYNADGTLKTSFTSNQNIDNSTGKGIQPVTFAADAPSLGDGETYKAYTWSAYADKQELLPESEGGKRMSAPYTAPEQIKELLITNETKDGIEDFDYDGAVYAGAAAPEATAAPKVSNLSDFNGWSGRGSGGKTLTLGEKNGMKYATVQTDGAKLSNGTSVANQGSFYIAKDFEKAIGTSGRYMISADLKYITGGNATAGLNFRFVDGNTVANPAGTESLSAFTIAGEGKVLVNGTAVGQIAALGFSKVTYILDMDLGTATVSVTGFEPKTVNLENYQTTDTVVLPSKTSAFMFESSKLATGVQVANLTVAQLEDKPLPEYTVKVKTPDTRKGTVDLTYAEKPVETEAPAVTETPATTETPSTTETPATTEAPATTEVPATTGAPATTASPTNDPAVNPSSVELAEVTAAPKQTATITYTEEEVAKITSDGALDAVMIEAVYEDGKIVSVKTQPVKTDAAGEKTVDVADGSKLMLWNSVEEMEPVADAINAEIPATPDEKALTLPINTVVTAKATANEGYVFMGWMNENGKVVAEEAEYTFRLRGDTELTAKFVKNPKIEETTNFSLVPEKPSIKAAAGAKTQINVADAVNKEGTPVFDLKNSDITWSCDEKGVSVDANGLLTLDDTFSLGESLEKDIVVKGTINGIEKSCTITVFGYEYYENMTEGSTSYDGLFMEISSKTAIVFPGANTAHTYKLSAPVALDKKTTVKYDNVWSGSNTCGQFRTLNFKNSSGTTIFSIPYTWDTIKIGETAIEKAVVKNTYSTVTVEIDPTSNAVKIAAGNGSVETTLAANAGDIAEIEFKSAGSVPGPDQRALGISNVTIIK